MFPEDVNHMCLVFSFFAWEHTSPGWICADILKLPQSSGAVCKDKIDRISC